jgi:hypothetical protein
MPTITQAGAIPLPVTELLAAEVAAATTLAPGLTTDLPGSLVEDMASTATGALVVIDQAVADLINSLSPLTANASVLYNLGSVYGVQQGSNSNTSVYVTFVSSEIGFPINPGFVVSDGTNQYVVQDGGDIGTSGQSQPLFCLSVQDGSFAVPIGTVVQIVSSLPSTIVMSCINLTAGLPGDLQESLEEYRAQVIQAGQATCQGVPQFLKTQLNNVIGTQANLISVRQIGNNWQIICGGGDPYQVANAILIGVPNIGNIVGSTILASNITNGYPAVVTTNLNHGYATGQIIEFVGATGMTGINSIPFLAVVTGQKTFTLNVQIASLVWSGGTVTVTTIEPHGLSGTAIGPIYAALPSAYSGTFTFTITSATTFTYPLATNPGVATATGYTSFSSISSGTYNANTAIVTPNLRNITVSINDYPDTYSITFVNPPVQTVTVSLIWNTISTNYVSSVAVISAATPALVAYINDIAVGQPINIFDMQNAFQASVANLLQINLISKMLFTVTINGITTAPNTNTGVIYGDTESYFETTNALITIAQG